jgi:hypothetical protein
MQWIINYLPFVCPSFTQPVWHYSLQQKPVTQLYQWSLTLLKIKITHNTGNCWTPPPHAHTCAHTQQSKASDSQVQSSWSHAATSFASCWTLTTISFIWFVLQIQSYICEVMWPQNTFLTFKSGWGCLRTADLASLAQNIVLIWDRM